MHVCVFIDFWFTETYILDPHNLPKPRRSLNEKAMRGNTITNPGSNTDNQFSQKSPEEINNVYLSMCLSIYLYLFIYLMSVGTVLYNYTRLDKIYETPCRKHISLTIKAGLFNYWWGCKWSTLEPAILLFSSEALRANAVMSLPFLWPIRPLSLSAWHTFLHGWRL